MVSCCPRLCGLGYPGLSSLGDQVMSQHQTTDEGVNEQISKEAIWVSGEDRNLAVLRHRVACTHPLPTLQLLDLHHHAGSLGSPPAL